MTRGTYTVLVELDADADVVVGALGDRHLPAGTYAYTGSAFGPGGFARIDRHREVAAGEQDVRHWHVDYLLGVAGARVVGDVRTAGRDAECAVARALADECQPVPGFGASDCDCDSHLVAGGDGALRAAVEATHDAVTGP